VTVPGFTAGALGDVALLVADGPATAAGAFSGDANAVLWTRQVTHDGVLRAVALDPHAGDRTGPAGFQHVHTVAEQAAERLGIGAIDVAVLPGPALPPVTRAYAGWRVAAHATDHAVVLLTDASASASDLAAALAEALDSVPWAERSALVLAGGVSQGAPGVPELATAFADLLDSLPVPTPTSAPTHESTFHV